MKKTIFYTFILTLTFSLNTFAKFKDSVVAKVNGAKIFKSEFLTRYNQNLLYVSSKKVTPKKIITDMINEKIGIQNAKKEKLDKNKIVKDKMETVLFHAKISKDIAPLLKKIKVTDQDVKYYYKKYPEYRTAQILFRMKAKPIKMEKKAALNQANKVYKILKKKPKSFSQMANRYSQSQASQIGGDIGFQPAVKYAPEYFEAIKGKRIGFISKPTRTQFGYQIIKILDLKKYSDINVQLYKKLVYDQKRDRVMENYFAKLRKKSSIWIDSNYIK